DRTVLWNAAYQEQQFLHLRTPFRRAQTQVRHDHPHTLSACAQLDIQRAARLAPSDSQIVATHLPEVAGGEECVAQGARVGGWSRACDGSHAGGRRQRIDLTIQSVDLLQADRIAAQLVDDTRNTLDVVAHVTPNASVDVVGPDLQQIASRREITLLRL